MTLPGAEQPQVFLSYASEDLGTAKRLNEQLRLRGVRVWFDKDDLRPGPFKPQITKEIARSRYFLFCVSPASLRKIGDKPGFQDSELTYATEIAMRQSEQDFVIVPVRLEETGRGDSRLSIYQQFDLFPDWDAAIVRLAGLFGPEDASTPDNHLTNVLVSKVEMLYEARRYEKALSMVDALEEVAGESQKSANARASTLHALGRYDEALQVFETASNRWGDNEVSWANRGQVLRSLTRYEEALVAIDRSLSIERNDEVLMRKAAVLYVLNRISEAGGVYEDVLVHNPGYVNAYIGLATVNATKDSPDYSRALELSEQALSMEPDSTLGIDIKGWALFKLERLELAIEAFQRSLALGSTDPKTPRRLAFALSRLKRYEEALAVHEAVLARDPTNTAAADGKFWSLFALARIPECQAMIDAIIEPANPDAAFWIRTAQWLTGVGKISDAASAYDKALALDPGNTEAVVVRDRLRNKLGRVDQ